MTIARAERPVASTTGLRSIFCYDPSDRFFPTYSKSLKSCLIQLEDWLGDRSAGLLGCQRNCPVLVRYRDSPELPDRRGILLEPRNSDGDKPAFHAWKMAPFHRT